MRPAAQQRLLAVKENQPIEQQTREVLLRFLRQAYRRPPTIWIWHAWKDWSRSNSQWLEVGSGDTDGFRSHVVLTQVSVSCRVG